MNNRSGEAGRGSFFRRFMQYMNERFPLHQNGVLLLLIFASLYLVSAGRAGIRPVEFIVGYAGYLLFFLQLRIMDEYKDYETDMKFKPHRPVQRGLISLNELKPVLVAVIILELAAAFSAGTGPGLLMAAGIAYSFLMFAEFFVPKWLNKHIYIYAVSHGIVSVFITAYAWFVPQTHASLFSRGFYVMLAVVLAAGFSYEIGRKIRRKNEETEGLDTYTSVSGENVPVIILMLLGIVMAFCGAYFGSFAVLVSVIYTAALLAYVIFPETFTKGCFVEYAVLLITVVYFILIIITMMKPAVA